MSKINKKFKKVVVLDTVIFYPEHRSLLNSIADEVVEYPSSLPEGLEKQYEENPELFLNKKCYTQIATDNTPLQLLMNRVEGAEVIVSCWTNIPDEILQLNPQLKLIIFWTHEKEHRINLELANKLGITVANIPDYGTDAVAEVVFAGFWQLLLRNFGSKLDTSLGMNVSHAIINNVFDHFRKLTDNEKNTRGGKFSHHFHKIGRAKFDFNQKNIDQLIPERLIEHKHVGLLNIRNGEETIRSLSSFGVICEQYSISQSSLATFYKFLTENEIVYYDSNNINKEDLEKISVMYAEKIIDVQSLASAQYDIHTKIFGIAGLGRIGLRVAGFAKQLGFRVMYYSKTRDLDLEQKLGIEFTELADLLQKADVVSIHLPAHKAENLINEKMIKTLKKGMIFINTADGNAIDQPALTTRMLAGEVFAYLDVYPGLPRKDILGMPMADKTDWKIRKEISNNVLAYRAGWKTQESISVKTYKLLGAMIEFLIK